MGITRMPNGEYVDIPDDAPPEVVRKITAQYADKPAANTRAKPAGRRGNMSVNETTEANRRAERRRKLGVQAGNSFGARVGNSASLNFMDEVAGALSAGTRGVVNAVSKGDIGEIGSEYRVARDVYNQEQLQYERENPGKALTADLGGAAMLPLGAGTAAVGKLASGAGKVGMTRTAKALEGVARSANAGPIRGAALIGAGYGAINAAGNADTLADIPGDAAQGGVVGAAFGGALGTVGQLGRKGYQILKDRSQGNATNTAYMRIADLLENGRLTPQQAAQQIKKSQKQGSDVRMMDLTPGLRAQAAHIARNPRVPGSNDIIDVAGGRVEARNAKFANTAKERAGINTDAYTTGQAIKGARKAHGQKFDDVLDRELQPSGDIVALIGHQTHQSAKAFRRGIKAAQNDRDVTGKFDADTLTFIPSMRVFKYVKEAFDDDIAAAMRKGRTNEASQLSERLSEVKDAIGKQNPEYLDLVAGQRDYFQKQAAVELGEAAMRRMKFEPDVLLREVQALPANAQMEARIGIIDALGKLDAKTDPVRALKAMYNNEAQRKVLDFAFGGKRQARSFKKWFDREANASITDKMVQPHTQSITSAMDQVGSMEQAGTSIFRNALRGFAFGGKAGAISNMVRAMQDLSGGTTTHVQDEIARILLSKGQGVVKGTEAAKKYLNARRENDKRFAKIIGRSTQQPLTSLTGD